MYLTILFLPIFSGIIAGLLGRKIGVSGVHILSCTCLFSAAFLSLVCFYEVALSHSPLYIHLFTWVDSELFKVDWAFYFDSLSITMISTVLIVSSFVHLYSTWYIENDPHQQRFFSYLSLFTFFILVLVSGANYLVLFVGWEGIGVISYLLINFWFTRLQANKSAISALTTNRVGDIFFTIGIIVIFWACGSLDFATVFSVAHLLNTDLITIISICLLIGSCAKSAQFGLHVWLPQAMEGPTPVSSLIHAATLVTAGVYLLMRSSPLIEHSDIALTAITIVGATTAFIAASIGLTTTDLKRTIAYSTISQIGYLFMAVGLSQYGPALFHLVNHAFFKALLFLSAGGVLHSMSDQQDLRRLGGLIRFMPFTFIVILIGSMSLIAFPFLSGFYSKDLILELSWGAYSFNGSFAYVLGSIAAGFTAFYSFKLLSIVFLSYPNASKQSYKNVHDQPTLVIFVLTILCLFGIFSGYMIRDIFVGIGSDIFSHSLITHPNHISLIEAEFSIPLFFKLLPLIFTLLGALFGILFYHGLALFNVEISMSSIGKKLYTFLNTKYMYDIIINKYIIENGLKIGLITSKLLDRGAVEMLGPHGITTSLYKTSTKLGQLDNGLVVDYGLAIILSVILLTLYMFIPLIIGGDIGDIRIVIVYVAALLSLL